MIDGKITKQIYETKVLYKEGTKENRQSQYDKRYKRRIREKSSWKELNKCKMVEGRKWLRVKHE